MPAGGRQGALGRLRAVSARHNSRVRRSRERSRAGWTAGMRRTRSAVSTSRPWAWAAWDVAEFYGRRDWDESDPHTLGGPLDLGITFIEPRTSKARSQRGARRPRHRRPRPRCSSPRSSASTGPPGDGQRVSEATAAYVRPAWTRHCCVSAWTSSTLLPPRPPQTAEIEETVWGDAPSWYRRARLRHLACREVEG